MTGILLMLGVSPFVLVFSIAGIARNRSRWKIYIPLFILSVSVLGYQYVPMRTNDLTRYYSTIETVGDMGFSAAMSYLADGLIVKNVVFWLIGRSGMPQLLPLLTAAAVYGVMIYITCDSAKTYHCEKDVIKVLLIQMMALSFFGQLGTVRSIVSYALILLAVYLDIEKKKKGLILLLLYTAPCFIHITGVLLAGLRLLFLFTADIKKIFVSGLLFFTAINALSNIRWIADAGGIISVFFSKWNAYIHMGGTSAWDIYLDGNIGFQLYKYVILAFMLAFMYMILYIRRKQKAGRDERNLRFDQYILALCIVTCAVLLFMHANHFDRFYSVIIVGSGSILIPVFGKNSRIRKSRTLTYIKLGMLYLLIPIKLYQIHLDRWSVNWKEIILSYFGSSIYQILFEFAAGIMG